MSGPVQTFPGEPSGLNFKRAPVDTPEPHRGRARRPKSASFPQRGGDGLRHETLRHVIYYSVEREDIERDGVRRPFVVCFWHKADMLNALTTREAPRVVKAANRQGVVNPCQIARRERPGSAQNLNLYFFPKKNVKFSLHKLGELS
jgi:hypothetical protein